MTDITFPDTLQDFGEWLFDGVSADPCSDHADVYCMNLLLFRKTEFLNVIFDMLIIMSLCFFLNPYGFLKALRKLGTE